MSAMETYVINLDRSPSRMEEADKQLQSIGLYYKRLSAVDGRSLSDQPEQVARKYSGRDLLPGEIGCFLSHRRAAEVFLASDADLGLVLEDDVKVTPQSRACLDAIIAANDRFTIWDVANLGQPAKFWRTPVRRAVFDGPQQLFHAHHFPVTTTALLWTRGGAQMFLMMSEERRYPVDVQLQTWVAETDRGLAFDVPPFTHRTEPSDIHIGTEKRTKLKGYRAPDYRKQKITRQATTIYSAIRHKYSQGG